MDEVFVISRDVQMARDRNCAAYFLNALNLSAPTLGAEVNVLGNGYLGVVVKA